MGRVLVWEHKHGRDMYRADTDERLEKAARKVLKTLIEWGYMWEPTLDTYGIDMEVAELSDEQVAELPTQSLREDAEKQKQKLARSTAAFAEDKQEWDDAHKILAGEEVWHERIARRQTGPNKGELFPPVQVTAWRILQGRNGAEYESFELDYMTDPDDDNA